MDKQILSVFKKEMRELLRDRRVRSSAIIGPFLMVFVMMFVMGTAINTIVSDKNAIKVHVVAPRDDDALMRALKKEKDKYTVVAVDSDAAGRELLAKGKASVVVELPAEQPTQTSPVTYKVLYDGKEERSQMAEADIQKKVLELNKNRLEQELQSAHIDVTKLTPYQLVPEDTKNGKGADTLLLSMIPYLVVFLAFVGGMSAASDLVAGEKERNTLETLLISPVPRKKIVLGKFLSLAVICFFSSCSGLLGLLVATSRQMPGASDIFKNGSGLTGAAIGEVLIVMIPTVALFASVLIAISSFAKNTREAQTYLSLGSIVVVIPSVLSQFLGFSELGSSRMINFIPILNASSAIRNALMGTLDATSLLLTTGISTAIALIAITIAVRLCNREEVLLRI